MAVVFIPILMVLNKVWLLCLTSISDCFFSLTAHTYTCFSTLLNSTNGPDFLLALDSLRVQGDSEKSPWWIPGPQVELQIFILKVKNDCHNHTMTSVTLQNMPCTSATRKQSMLSLQIPGLLLLYLEIMPACLYVSMKEWEVCFSEYIQRLYKSSKTKRQPNCLNRKGLEQTLL